MAIEKIRVNKKMTKYRLVSTLQTDLDNRKQIITENANNLKAKKTFGKTYTLIRSSVTSILCRFLWRRSYSTGNISGKLRVK